MISKLGRGVLVEDKGYALALHYRLAPDKGPAVIEEVSATTVLYPGDVATVLPTGSLLIEVAP